MAYLTFNEGVFSDTYNKIKDRVSSNIEHIKKTASDVSGHVLGTVKNAALRAHQISGNVAENIHNFGNKVGASGFENYEDNKNLHKPIDTDKIKQHLSNIDPKKSISNVVSKFTTPSKVQATNNLKKMGLVGTRQEINKIKNK